MMLTKNKSIKEQDYNIPYPWSGLTLACVRILQLYAKVFEQDISKLNAKKSCKNCKCSRDGHEVIAEHGARSRLGFLGHESLDARTLGYTFVPPGLTTARQVDQYYSSLPSEEVPKLGSKGETIRSQRIVRQLPKQDLSLSACKFVESEYATSYEDFVSGRNQVALDVGMAKIAPPNGICVGCDRPVSPQQIVVAAPRLGSSVWHPGCFKCTDCDDLLVDLVYCAYEDSIYCERHYAEKMKPRCAGCDEVQAWNGQNLNPLEYGCEKDEYERLAPKMCRKEIAPQDISKMALFNCKDGTSNRSCSCIKLGLKYSTKCCQCFGISCGNECIISEAN